MSTTRSAPRASQHDKLSDSCRSRRNTGAIKVGPSSDCRPPPRFEGGSMTARHPESRLDPWPRIKRPQPCCVCVNDTLATALGRQ